MIKFGNKDITGLRYVLPPQTRSSEPKAPIVLRIVKIENGLERTLYQDTTKIIYHIDSAPGYVYETPVVYGTACTDIMPEELGKSRPAERTIQYIRGENQIISDGCSISDVQMFTKKHKENLSYDTTFTYDGETWSEPVTEYGIVINTTPQRGDIIKAHCIYDNEDYRFVGWTMKESSASSAIPIYGKSDYYQNYVKNKSKYTFKRTYVTSHESVELYAVWEKDITLKYSYVEATSTSGTKISLKSDVKQKVYSCLGNVGIINPTFNIERQTLNAFSVDPVTGAKESYVNNFKNIGWSLDPNYVRDNKGNTRANMATSGCYIYESSTADSISITLRTNTILYGIYEKKLELQVVYHKEDRLNEIDEDYNIIYKNKISTTTYAYMECIPSVSNYYSAESLKNIGTTTWKDCVFFPTLSLSPVEYKYIYTDTTDGATKEYINWVYNGLYKNVLVSTQYSYVTEDKSTYIDNSNTNKTFITLGSSTTLYGNYIRPVICTYYYDGEYYTPEFGKTTPIDKPAKYITKTIYHTYYGDTDKPVFATENLDKVYVDYNKIWTGLTWSNDEVSYDFSKILEPWEDITLFATYKARSNLKYYDCEEIEVTINKDIIKKITEDGIVYVDFYDFISPSENLYPSQDTNWDFLGYSNNPSVSYTSDKNIYMDIDYPQDEDGILVNLLRYNETTGKEYIVEEVLSPIYNHIISSTFVYNNKSVGLTTTNYAYKKNTWLYGYEKANVNVWVNPKFDIPVNLIGWAYTLYAGLNESPTGFDLDKFAPVRYSTMNNRILYARCVKDIIITQYITSTIKYEKTYSLIVDAYNCIRNPEYKLLDNYTYNNKSYVCDAWTYAYDGFSPIDSSTITVGYNNVTVYRLVKESPRITCYYTVNGAENTVKSVYNTKDTYRNAYVDKVLPVTIKVPSESQLGTKYDTRFSGKSKTIIYNNVSYKFNLTENFAGFSVEEGKVETFLDDGMYIKYGFNDGKRDNGKEYLYMPSYEIEVASNLNLYAVYTKPCTIYVVENNQGTIKINNNSAINSNGEKVTGFVFPNSYNPNIIGLDKTYISKVHTISKVVEDEVLVYSSTKVTCPSYATMHKTYKLSYVDLYEYGGYWGFYYDMNGDTPVGTRRTGSTPESVTVVPGYRDGVITLSTKKINPGHVTPEFID